MKLGVVSDTHGDIDYLQKVYSRLLKKDKINTFVHLGDYYEDTDALEVSPEINLIRVPGVFSSCYQNQDIPNRIIQKIEGCKILFTHTNIHHENDPQNAKTPEELVAAEEINLVLYGHTHLPKGEKKGNTWWVNPGHMKEQDNRGSFASYAVIEINQKILNISIRDFLSGTEIWQLSENFCSVLKVY